MKDNCFKILLHSCVRNRFVKINNALRKRLSKSFHITLMRDVHLLKYVFFYTRSRIVSIFIGKKSYESFYGSFTRQVHLEICRISAAFNLCFGSQMLFIILMDFINLVFVWTASYQATYFYFANEKHKNLVAIFAIYMTILATIVPLGKIFYITNTSDVATKEVESDTFFILKYF